MGSLVNKIVKVSTLGAVKDITGQEAAADAAREAGQLQATAAEQGIAETRRQFDVATELQRPSFEAGDVARQELIASLGLSGQEAESQFFDRFKETRGQQFLRKQQERALTRTAAARGQSLGGNVLTALQEQAEGRAAGRLGEFQSRLAGIAGAGQTAATFTGQLGQQTGANVANLLGTAGQARASGILGAQQADALATQQVLQLGSAAASAFSDMRLKKNIKKVGEANGHNWYSWTWNNLANKLGLHGEDNGVIANEIQITNPHLITERSGFLTVNYAGLGV